MPFPEWGQSYNALCVPLTSDWQCSLVPARDVQDVDRGWALSYEERQKKLKEREEQIEQDRRDFDRLFRVAISRHATGACRDFGAYAAFISEHLRISGSSAPVDGDSVTRILRNAVRDGGLIPAIDRAWRGSRRVARSYAPQSWPKRLPDPKPVIYGIRHGQFIPLDADGRFIDRTPYVPVAARVAATASQAAGSSGRADWPGAVETAVGAVPGGASGDDNDSALEDDFNTAAGDVSTPLGDARPFAYSDGAMGGDVADLAARGVSEAEEADCFGQYERDMELCRALGRAMGGSRGLALCEQNAFDNYQQCRGY